MRTVQLRKETYWSRIVKKIDVEIRQSILREDPSLRFRRRLMKAVSGKKLIVPHLLSLELTNHCNAGCTFCAQPSQMRREKGFMSDELFEIIVKNIRKFGQVGRVMLGGIGEPFLHKKIIDMIVQLKSQGVYVIATTNGSVFGRVSCKDLVESGIDKLSISLDAIDNSYLSHIKPGIRMSIEDIERSIKNIYDYKREIGSKTPHILLRYQILADSNNTKDKAREKMLMMKRKNVICDDIDLRKQHNWGNQLNDYEASEKPLGKEDICSQFWRSMQVQWNGDVSLCCLDYDGKIVLGNLFKNNIREIYNSKPMSDARRMYLCGTIGKHPLCSGCYR